MKQSRQYAFIVALMASAALTACGDNSSAPEPTPAEPTASESPAPAPVETTAPAPEETSASTPAAEPTDEAPATAPTEAAPTGDSAAAPAADNPVAALAAPYNTADYDQGRRQFAKCRSCHLIDEGAGHRVGPNLHGVFDRSIGALEDFKYSKAALEADFQWTPEQLDNWLANPKQFLPGNRMTFAGIANEEQRKNLIAYLLVETSK